MKLEHSDSLHLRAAQGWLELGVPLEAYKELEKISPRLRLHPEVLLMRYEVFAKVTLWEAAFYVSQALVELAPRESLGWINQAFALRKMPLRGAKAAWDVLLPAADKFPGNPIIPYHLACYACQLGRSKEAWGWLARAFSVGDPDDFKLLALDEPDLEPLWVDIDKM